MKQQEINQFWEEEWNYSEKFMPEIIKYLKAAFIEIGWGEADIRIADEYEDMHHNTDLFAVFPNGRVLRVSVRVRKWNAQWYRKNVKEITVRCFLALNKKLCKDKNGYVITDTEFRKMMDGWGDIIVYCIADPTDTHLASMYVGLTDKLREYNRYFEKHSGEGLVYIMRNGEVVDKGKIVREWDANRERVAGNTGCGFLVYMKEGPDAVPDMTLIDYRFLEG